MSKFLGNITVGSQNVTEKVVLLDGDNINSVELSAPTTIDSNYQIKLPPNVGGVGQVMMNTGSGNTSWQRSDYTQFITTNGETAVNSTAQSVLSQNTDVNMVLPDTSTTVGNTHRLVYPGKSLPSLSQGPTIATTSLAYNPSTNIVYMGIGISNTSYLGVTYYGILAYNLTTDQVVPFVQLYGGVSSLRVDPTNTYLYAFGAFTYARKSNGDGQTTTGSIRIALSDETLLNGNVVYRVNDAVSKNNIEFDTVNNYIYFTSSSSSSKISTISTVQSLGLVALSRNDPADITTSFSYDFGVPLNGRMAQNSTHIYLSSNNSGIVNGIAVSAGVFRITKSTNQIDQTWIFSTQSASFQRLLIDDVNGYLYVAFSNNIIITPVGSSTTASHSGIFRLNINQTGANALDPTWNPNANIGVLSLALDTINSVIYVGGNFTAIGGQSRNRIAKLSTTGTGLADATWNPNSSNIVNSLTLDTANSVIYVGGNFTTIGGQSRNRIAKLSTTGTGLADATWNPNANSEINYLELDIVNSVIYVGGSFATIGGQSRNNIAKLSTTGTGLADATWNPNANSAVSLLALDTVNNELYIGGGFTTLSGQTATPFLAKVDTTGTGSAVTTWLSRASSAVNSLSYDSTTGTLFALGSIALYYGGSSTPITSTSIVRTNTSLVYDATWTVASTTGTFQSIALDVPNNQLYVGGTFTSIGGQTVVNLARVSLTTGLADATWIPNVNGLINRIDVYNNNVYILGSFTTINNISNRAIARIPNNSIIADVGWNPGAVNGTALSGYLDTVGGFFYISSSGGASFTFGTNSIQAYVTRVNLSDASPDYTWIPIETATYNNPTIQWTGSKILISASQQITGLQYSGGSAGNLLVLYTDKYVRVNNLSTDVIGVNATNYKNIYALPTVLSYMNIGVVGGKNTWFDI